MPSVKLTNVSRSVLDLLERGGRGPSRQDRYPLNISSTRFMDNFSSSLFISVLAGLIVILVEPLVKLLVKFFLHRKKNNPKATPLVDTGLQSPSPDSDLLNGQAVPAEFLEYYHKLTVGILGVLSGTAFGIFLISWVNMSTDEYWFLIPVFITAVGGGASAVAIDFRVRGYAISFRLRVLTALIFGFFGGIVLLAVMIVAAAGLVIYYIVVELRDYNKR